MYETIATATQAQLILKNKGLVLEEQDIETLIEVLDYAIDNLDMDNLTAVDFLSNLKEALEGSK